MTSRRHILVALGAAPALWQGPLALAQGNTPIRILVGAPAGGRVAGMLQQPVHGFADAGGVAGIGFWGAGDCFCFDS